MNFIKSYYQQILPSIAFEYGTDIYQSNYHLLIIARDISMLVIFKNVLDTFCSCSRQTSLV